MADERLGASFSIDVTQLKAGLAQANRLIRESQSEFKAAAAGMDDWTKSEDGLRARIESLNKITAIQREKVNALTQQYEELIADGLDPTSAEAVKLRTQINNEEAALRSNEAELEKQTEALENLGDETEETGNKFEKFGEIAKTAGKVAAAAIAAIGAGVVSLTKSAIESYANYEQLVGGVETLFGAGGQSIQEYAKSVGKTVSEVEDEYGKLMTAQNTMLRNANDAYKTAGMTANEYMENVTSFSASLISSLGGDTLAAAKAADRAMIDISDNANKMGTDMQSIVDTYQSLSRGNYQMLDNLKLGYGGTKTEMERMIADANKVKEANGEMANLSIDSFADVTEAIHIIQNEMGITGTTAKEASSTISGSVGMVQASWGNLLTGIADDTADFDQLINNFVDAIGSAAENLIPRIATALSGIVQLVQKLLPQIPPLIQEFLPVVVNGIMEVTAGLVEILPSIVDTIMQVFPMILTALIEMLPTLISTLVTMITQIIDALTNMLPTIIDAIIEVVPLLIDALVAAIPQLLQAAIQFLMAIVDAIPTIIQILVAVLPQINQTIMTALFEAIPQLLEGAIELLMAIVDAIPVFIPILVEALPEIITTMTETLINNIPVILNAAIELLMAIVKAIPTIVTSLIAALPQIITSTVNFLIQNIPMILKGAVELFMGIIKAIPQIVTELVKSLPQIIKTIVSVLKEGIPQLIQAGKDLLSGLFTGMLDPSKIWQSVKKLFNSIMDGLKSLFGIHSPSTVMADIIGKNLALGIGEGFDENIDGVNKRIAKAINVESPSLNVSGTAATAGRTINVYQTNNYAQAHSRYEIYKSKQQTAAAVRLALAGV